MTKPNSCEIIVVMDRSGSMSDIAKDMEGGFDTFMDDQKKQPGQCVVTLAQFDDKYEVVYEGQLVAKVPKCSLVPRGATALVDAVGKTINTVGERFKIMSEFERPEKVVFLIITDGHENASREFTTQQVRDMVKHQTEVYKWQFVYLGADADAFDEAGAIGVLSAAQYTATGKGTRSASAAVSRAVMSYRANTCVDATLNVPKDLTEPQ